MLNSAQTRISSPRAQGISLGHRPPDFGSLPAGRSDPCLLGRRKEGILTGGRQKSHSEIGGSRCYKKVWTSEERILIMRNGWLVVSTVLAALAVSALVAPVYGQDSNGPSPIGTLDTTNYKYDYLVDSS